MIDFLLTAILALALGLLALAALLWIALLGLAGVLALGGFLMPPSPSPKPRPEEWK